MGERKGENRRGEERVRRESQVSLTRNKKLKKIGKKPQVNRQREEGEEKEEASDMNKGREGGTGNRPVCKCGRLSYPGASSTLTPPQRSN